MSLHEESTRISLIVAAPEFKPGAATTLSEQIDFYPTLAELAGLTVPKHCQGKSLVPVLRDHTLSVRDMAYTVTRAESAIRTDGWAYIRHTDGSTEL